MKAQHRIDEMTKEKVTVSRERGLPVHQPTSAITLTLPNHFHHNDIMFLSTNTLITGGTFTHVQGATIGAIKIHEASV